LFFGRRRPERLSPFVRVKDKLIKVSPHMKYLGVIVDSRLNFKTHFDYIGDKVDKVTRALGQLMSNLRGPHERKRRLYANILTSVILYTAPIWADSLAVSMSSRRRFRQWQRAIAVRVCSTYPSVSFDSVAGSISASRAIGCGACTCFLEDSERETPR